MSSFGVSQIRCQFCVVYQDCVFLVFQLSLACTSLSFESLRFVRKLGPVRWKLSLSCQELLSESLLSDFWWAFSLVADCENHRWAPELLPSSPFDLKDSNRMSLARKNFRWRVFNCVLAGATLSSCQPCRRSLLLPVFAVVAITVVIFPQDGCRQFGRDLSS